MPFDVRSTVTDKPKPLRALFYGHSKAGKSTAAGTFPKPFFFSLEEESGVASLSQLENESRYVSINNIAQMNEVVRWFAEKYQQEGFRTAVIDTATLFGRMVNMELSQNGDRGLEFKDWSKFLMHFLNIRNVLHRCDVHVVWVCHVDEMKVGETVIGLKPKLQGQALKEICQTVGLIGYIDKVQTKPEYDDKGAVVKESVTVHRLWTKCPYGLQPPFEVGTWYDGALVKGLYKPSFQELAKYLAPHDEAGKPVGRQHITI